MGKKIRVMLADAEDGFRSDLQVVLDKSRRFQVVRAAADGAQAIQAIAECQPELLILDLILPQEDGFKVLEATAAMEQPPKVVVVTGFINEYIMERVSAYGVRDVRQKPISVNSLAKQLRAIAARDFPQA